MQPYSTVLGSQLPASASIEVKEYMEELSSPRIDDQSVTLPHSFPAVDHFTELTTETVDRVIHEMNNIAVCILSLKNQKDKGGNKETVQCLEQHIVDELGEIYLILLNLHQLSYDPIANTLLTLGKATINSLGMNESSQKYWDGLTKDLVITEKQANLSSSSSSPEVSSQQSNSLLNKKIVVKKLFTPFINQEIVKYARPTSSPIEISDLKFQGNNNNEKLATIKASVSSIIQGLKTFLDYHELNQGNDKAYTVINKELMWLALIYSQLMGHRANLKMSGLEGTVTIVSYQLKEIYKTYRYVENWWNGCQPDFPL